MTAVAPYRKSRDQIFNHVKDLDFPFAKEYRHIEQHIGIKGARTRRFAVEEPGGFCSRWCDV